MNSTIQLDPTDLSTGYFKQNSNVMGNTKESNFENVLSNVGKQSNNKNVVKSTDKSLVNNDIRKSEELGLKEKKVDDNIDTSKRIGKDCKKTDNNNYNDYTSYDKMSIQDKEPMQSVEDFEKDLNDLCGDIRENIKDILEINDDTLNRIMQMLSIENIQLLQVEIGQKILLVANNSDSVSDVLINEKMSQDMTELIDFYNNGINEIVSTKSMDESVDELKNMLLDATNRLENKKQDDNMSNEVEVVINDTRNIEKMMSQPQNINIVENNRTYINDSESKMQTERTEKFGDIKDITKKDSDDIEDTTLNDNKNSVQNLAQSNNKDLEENEFSANDEDKNFDGESPSTDKKIVKSGQEEFLKAEDFAYDMGAVKKENNIILEPLKDEMVYIKQLKDIVNQVTERIKLDINTESTKLEMQLNPENLGKMTLSITQKGAVLTAHITVENNIAKEALESGMQILKESLDEQNVKVTEVEVSVASSNLNNNNEQNNNSFTGQQNNNKKDNKKLDINIDDIAQIMEQDNEQIIVDGVLQDVSSVNYTA